MIGPIEQRLRARLNYGLGLTRLEAHKLGGPMALGILRRLLDEGVAVEHEGRYTLTSYTPDPAALEAGERARQQRQLELRRAAAEREERARQLEAERAEQERAAAAARKRDEERRQINERLNAARTDEERERIEEEVNALARVPSLLRRIRARPVRAIDSALFGIELDQ